MTIKETATAQSDAYRSTPSTGDVSSMKYRSVGVSTVDEPTTRISKGCTMTTAIEPSIDPAEHVRLVEAEYQQAEAAMRQTETRLQEIDRQLAAAPGQVEDLQQRLYSLLSAPSDSAAYNRKVSEVQDAIRQAERLAEDRQAARGPLAQHYGQEQNELNQLQHNLIRARGGQLWAEFQATLLPLDAAFRQAETAWKAASTVAQRIASTAPHLGGSSRASDRLDELRPVLARALRESNAYAIALPCCQDHA